MDQYLSTVVVALITGVFGLITLLIQKKSDKVVNRIDKQTIFIEKEKIVKQRLDKKKKEKEDAMHEVMILILDTNIKIIEKMQEENGHMIDESIFREADDLKKKFDKLSEEIEDINREYEIVLDMAKELKNDVSVGNKSG